MANSWKPARRKGESEAKYFERYKSAKAAWEKSGGKAESPTRSQVATGRRKAVTDKVIPPSSGYQALLDAMGGKKKKKK